MPEPRRKLKCVWLSRHAPTPEQRVSLRDYEIVQISGLFVDARDAWGAATAGGRPDLIMAVLPVPMLAEFVRLAGSVPVIKAVMWQPPPNGGQEAIWSGRWERVRGVTVLREDWVPERRKRQDGRLSILS